MIRGYQIHYMTHPQSFIHHRNWYKNTAECVASASVIVLETARVALYAHTNDLVIKPRAKHIYINYRRHCCSVSPV